MEIHNVSGCMAFSLNVDGQEEIEMDNKQRAVVIDKIYSWMKRHADNLNIKLQKLSDSFVE